MPIRPEGVDEAILQGDGAADRLQHQEGDRAEAGIGDPEHRPLAKCAPGDPQRIILHDPIGEPGIGVAPDLDDALDRLRARLAGVWGGFAHGRRNG